MDLVLSQIGKERVRVLAVGNSFKPAARWTCAGLLGLSAAASAYGDVVGVLVLLGALATGLYGFDLLFSGISG